MLTRARLSAIGIVVLALMTSQAHTVALCDDCSAYHDCTNAAYSTKTACTSSVYSAETQCLSSAYLDYASCVSTCTVYCFYCEIEYTQEQNGCAAAAYQGYQNCEYGYQNDIQSCSSSFPGCG